MERMTMGNQKLHFILAAICFLTIVVSCVTTNSDAPTVLAQPSDNLAGITIITENGGHLAWSKENNKIAFDRLGKDKYFDLWIMNPDGSRIAALVLTHRPETRDRGSGMNVLIDLPTM
jgi:hypothetical protein